MGYCRLEHAAVDRVFGPVAGEDLAVGEEGREELVFEADVVRA